MHRNTYLLVTALAVVAALIVGINVGQILKQPAPKTPDAASVVAPTPTPTIAPIVPTAYRSEKCGFSLEYPSNLKKTETATDSAILTNPNNAKESIVIACQFEIPRPPLVDERIEFLVLESASTSATAAARLYHDASAKDGTPIDELIFRNPRTGYDIFIAGFGPLFDELVASVKLIP